MIESYFSKLEHTLSKVSLRDIEKCAHIINDTSISGGKIILIGNGGSAANAIHAATDLNMLFASTGRKSYAMCLTSNEADTSRISNDKEYASIFSEQLKLCFNSNDLLIALSTSGNSINIVEALKYIKSTFSVNRNILITANQGGDSRCLAGLVVSCNYSDTQIAEDMQQILFHAICRFLNASMVFKD